MRVPFIVYADFESFTPQLSSCQQNPDKSYTKRYKKLTPSGFCYHIKYFDDTLYSQEPVTFAKVNDDDVAQIFIDTLANNIKEIYKKINFPKGMIMTIHDITAYDNPLFVIFNEELGKDRVRDHCHLCGKIKGAAHEVCNLKYKISKFFPAVCHKLSGYYSHLLFKIFGNSKEDISCIQNNGENYISFTKQVIVDKFVTEKEKKVNVKRELRFIDSLRFMASSLDKLSSNLKINQFF